MGWYDPNYMWKKQITLLHSQVSGGSDLSNFPVLISRTDTNLKTTGNGGSVTNSNGYDIIFVDSTETTKLDHEIEKYVASTGEIEMWVRIPTLSASADTIIYMYYDNSTISTSQENKIGVWDSNYQAIYHLGNGTTLSGNDSTSNANNASTLNGTTAATGKIDGGASFNGSSNYLSIPSATSLGSYSSGTTISAWINLSTTTGVHAIVVNPTTTSSTSTDPFIYYFLAVQSGGTILFYLAKSTAGSRVTLQSLSTVSASTWVHVVGSWDGTTMRVYINAMLDSHTGSFSGPVGSGSADIRIGAWNSESTTEFFSGTIDEVRISNIARSAGWITTEYNNQSTPSSFMTVGSAQSGVTNNSMSSTDSLTVSDLGNLESWPVDALSAVSTPIDTDTALFVETLTVSDLASSLQSWTVDALSVDDSVTSYVDTVLSVESLIANDSISISTGYSVIEANSIADVLLDTDAFSTSDSGLIADNLLTVNAVSISDALSTSDVSNIAAWPVDTNMVTDAVLSTDVFSVIEAQTVLDTQLATDNYLPTDSNTLDDSGSTMQSIQAGSLMSSVDMLTVFDSFLAMDTASLIEQDTVSDAFLSSDITLPVDNLSASDSTISTGTFTSQDAQSILDLPLLTDVAMYSDSNTVNDSGSSMVSGSSGPVNNQMTSSDVVSLIDSLLVSDGAVWVDVLSLTSTSSLVSSIPLIFTLGATSVVASGRDGTMTAMSRDGNIVASGRG